MSGAERRRHVRAKPTADLPANAVIGAGLLRESVPILDVSVSGMALALGGKAAGERLALRVSLAGQGEHDVNVEVRWGTAEIAGVALVDPPDEAAHAIQRYVGELLERGAAG